MSLHGFTPLVKLAAAQLEQGALLPASMPPAAGASAAALFAITGSHTLLKGSGSVATPMVLPVTFIPVVDRAGSGSKLRPGGGISGSGGVGGSGHQQLHPAGSGSFTIPAYSRPLTQLDFISTGGSLLRV